MEPTLNLTEEEKAELRALMALSPDELKIREDHQQTRPDLADPTIELEQFKARIRK